MTPRNLREAERRYRHDQAKADKSREQRNQMIREALAAGKPHRQIALELRLDPNDPKSGLSYQRVGQFSKEGDR